MFGIDALPVELLDQAGRYDVQLIVEEPSVDRRPWRLPVVPDSATARLNIYQTERMVWASEYWNDKVGLSLTTRDGTQWILIEFGRKKLIFETNVSDPSKLQLNA